MPDGAADSPHFVPAGDYWLGSTWAPTNYAAIKGFARAGRLDVAREAALRHIECMHEVLESTGCIWENYCSERSAPGSWSGPDYCWSSLGPIALLLEVVLGLERQHWPRGRGAHRPALCPGGAARRPQHAARVSLRHHALRAGRVALW